MKKETALDVLRRDIVKLEAKRSEDLHLLKEQLHEAYESIKPVNLIKGIFKSATESPEITNGLSKAAMGVTSGHLIKKLLFGSSHNPLKKLAGAAIQAIVTNVVSNNSEKITEKGKDIFNIIKSFVTKKKEPARVEF
ncbi:MAG: hypothetical protein K0S53_1429 [Bacteroidetes bacterium]|jgi:Glu-tRNA(Gln) amidotransferase subunit E-like FAD-binding protein|nr:hypothetical protein [Bacteroidota bacterium]